MPNSEKAKIMKNKEAQSKHARKIASSSTGRIKLPPQGSTRKVESKGFESVVAAIKTHGEKLRNIPRLAVEVRPGYRKVNDQITTERAIVVSINPRDKNKMDLIPKTLGGVPVDVRIKTPSAQLRERSPKADAAGADASAKTPADDLAVPAWDLLGEEDVEDTEDDADGLIPYKPPPNLKLLKVKAPMRVICHVSPDAGWKTLSAFLQRVKKNLTVAMYDFTAPHVLDALTSAMKATRGELRLILDPNVHKDGVIKAKDVFEEQVRDSLADTLDTRFNFLWAAVKADGKVARGIFPSSYHTKVAVSGGRSFWLSSGNWQSTNQPDLDSLDLSVAQIQRRYNREWHVVVDHPELASLYEKFIKWDMKQAQHLQVEMEAFDVEADAGVNPELLIRKAIVEEVEEDVTRPRFFGAEEFTFTDDAPLEVQPLLTPDNYAEKIKALIKSAKNTLYFQNQYIKVKKNMNKDFTDLLDALLGKIKEGLDVKIILRKLPGSGEEQEALQYYAERLHGFNDLSLIKYQPGCHTKGIIIDSETVVIGSHNWSEQGVSKNRDASLIFFNRKIAQYYEKVFLYDWDNLADPKVLSDEAMPIVSKPHGAGPPMDDDASDIIHVPWDFYEDLS